MCTANIARSPLAEVLLAAYADILAAGRVEVRSAGVHARPDLPAAEHTVTIAERWGLELSGHRSQPVSDDLLRDSDLIITMSSRQRELLGPRLTGLGSRLFTLRELRRLTSSVSSGDLPSDPGERVRAVARSAHAQRPFSPRPTTDEDVDDPIGKPLAAFIEMANELVRLTEPLVPLLFPGDIDPSVVDRDGGIDLAPSLATRPGLRRSS